uniref:Beta-1,4-N-acetylgalactosaminyltransferase n=1 Tax=Culicoides sonorensis TaxID=179676 RepID=A0A336LBW0_CULSO
MASMLGRTQAIKAVFLVGFLLLLLNLLGPRWDTKFEKHGFAARLSSTAHYWPKRTHLHSEMTIQSNTNINISSTATSAELEPSNLLKEDVKYKKQPDVSFILEKNIDIESNSNNVSNHNKSSGNKLYANSTIIALTNSNHNNSSNDHKTNNSDVKTSLNSTQTSIKSQKNVTPTKTKSRKEFIAALMQQLGINPCPMVPDDLDGPIEVDTSYETLESVEKRLGPKLLPGGRYHPKKCNSKHRVAIIVPYRDREHHLPIFLKNIHPFLMKQQIDYGLFIVEQTSNGQFNRAKLMNIGFVEAVKMYNWDCFVFHDVDLLPMDDRNLYTCPEQPRHMSVAVDTLGFKLPYNTIFGGVSAMTVEQFLAVNGFSNSFWGWGGEDDDMSNRLKHRGYHISRYPVNMARYTMLTHKKEKANPRRYEKLQNGVKHFDNDGLNSLKYKVIEIKKTPLYIWIHVDVNQDQTTS